MCVCVCVCVFALLPLTSAPLDTIHTAAVGSAGTHNQSGMCRAARGSREEDLKILKGGGSVMG